MQNEFIISLDVIGGILFIGSLLVIIKRKNNHNLDTNLIFLLFFFLTINIITSFGNAIEWLENSIEFDEIGDYILTIVPLLWGGVFYGLIEYQHKKKIITAYNFSEFYKDIIAHDMGNILQSILFMVELSELENVNNPSFIEELKLIKDEIAKGEKLIKFTRLLSPEEYSSQTDVKLDISTIFENVETRLKKKFTDQKIFVSLKVKLSEKNKSRNLESITEILFVALFTNLINYYKISSDFKERSTSIEISIEILENKIVIFFPFVKYQEYLKETSKIDMFSTSRTSLESGISFSIIQLLFKSIDYKLNLENDKISKNGLKITLNETKER